MFLAFISAPLSSKSLHIRSWVRGQSSRAAAQMSGVRPFSLRTIHQSPNASDFASTSAPASRRSSATRRRPYLAAKDRAVMPSFSSVHSVSAPSPSRREASM